MKSRCNTRSLFNTGPHWAAALLCVAVLAWAGAAGAQLPIPPSSQFDITGFIEEATLGAGTTTLNVGPGTGAHQGGIIKVNGHVIIVPSETIVIFPANALTWQELFAQAPLPWGIAGTAVNTAAPGTPTSGMAMADCAAGVAGACTAPPLTTWEAQVIGNRVGDTYIAGLIYVSQQALNSGAGFINFIDYTLGEMRVGGVLNDATTGARVRLNDPVGRYGRPTTSPDIRFTVDPENPTITAGSGYPMCLPRTAPSGPGVGTDLLCPEQNRPIGPTGPVTQFTTANNSNPAFPLQPGVFPDSTIQAPFEVGDYITFAGTLVADCAVGAPCLGGGSTVGPWPAGGTPATWIAAHTIEANVSILTFQGSNPVYVRTDVTIIGTGGLTVLGVGEATIRTRFEGMMSDLTRAVHLFGMDLDSAGNESDRDYGTIGVDPGPPLGAVTGRWRFRPPCAPFGTVPAKPDKQCVMNQAGTFLPVTREVRAVVYDPAVVAAGTGNGFANPGFTSTAANGLVWGQYHAPILEYIFPENVPGSPIVENNFNAMPFLAQGGYTSAAGTLAGVLNPWPSNVLPTPTCVAPVANAGGPYSVVVTGTVTLAGSATGTAPTLAWTVSAGTLSSATIANPVYTAPATVQTVTASLTATNSCGSNTATATINVTAAAPPTLTAITAQTVPAGTSVRLQTVATDPAKLKLAVSFLQTGPGNPITPLVFNPNPNRQPPTAGTFSNSGSTFTSPSFTVTLAQFPANAASVTLTFSVTATNQAGVTSTATTTSVTFTKPVAADTVTITSVEDRTGKQRVIVNATDSVVSATVNLFLNPYQCNVNAAPCKQVVAGQPWVYDPDPANGGVGNQFTNNGGGLYIITAVGAPAPLCNATGGTFATPCTAKPITVRSSLGGLSPASAVTKIRQ